MSWNFVESFTYKKGKPKYLNVFWLIISNDAIIKCAFRSGCLLALQNYELGCFDLVKGKSQVCSSHCRHSLIGLMSTPEGERLMKVIFQSFSNISFDFRFFSKKSCVYHLVSKIQQTKKAVMKI